MIFFDDPLNLRLLEHNLGHQNVVGVSRFSPRQVAAAGLIMPIDLLPERPDRCRGKFVFVFCSQMR
jgi:hypothetical protein